MRISFNNHRNGSVGIAGRIFGTIFGLVFAAFGFFFIWNASLKPYLESAQTQEWIEVPATIIRSEVKGSDDSLKNVIAFDYSYEGRTRQSNQPHLNPPRLSYVEVQKLRDQLPVGKQTVAFVNPAAPAEAVLFLNTPNSLWVGLFAVPFLLIGLGIAAFSLFGKNKKHRSRGFSKRPSRGPLGKRNLFVSLFGLPFFAMGVAFCWLGGISPILQSRDAAEWPEIPCTITESFVESHRDSDGTTYSVEIRFRYDWEGKTYFGENYTFGNTSSSGRASKEAIVQRYPAGKSATCFINPLDPYEAVITTDVGWLPLGIIGFSSIFILVGLGLILFGLRRKREPGPSSVFSDEDPLRSPDEPMDLKPVTGRIPRALGTILFALVWNGISSVPIIIFFQQRKQGQSEVMVLVFGLIFAVIGVFLVIHSVRTILALRNPLPRVTITPGRIQPGSRMQLSWTLEGSVSRLNHLAIYLEGEEIAQYRRGTRTVTDRNVFFQECLFESREKGAFRRGSLEFPFSPNTVPSMKSDHNEIRWQLIFMGEIPRWPDLSETYPLPISPARS